MRSWDLCLPEKKMFSYFFVILSLSTSIAQNVTKMLLFFHLQFSCQNQVSPDCPPQQWRRTWNKNWSNMNMESLTVAKHAFPWYWFLVANMLAWYLQAHQQSETGVKGAGAHPREVFSPRHNFVWDWETRYVCISLKWRGQFCLQEKIFPISCCFSFLFYVST